MKNLALYLGVTSAICNPALTFAPLLVGGLVTTFGMPTNTAVLRESAEILASAVASFPALLWANKSNWRTIAVCSLVAILIGNIASVLSSGVQVLLVLRVITGLFEGTLLVLCLLVIAQQKAPREVV